MSEDERKTIKKLSKCDFSEIHKYFVSKSEEKKNMSKEEKQVRTGICIDRQIDFFDEIKNMYQDLYMS